jgi:phage tail sheath protein FI
MHAPNVRMGFTAEIVRGRAEGDMDAATLRPQTNPDLGGINQPRPLRNGDDGIPVADTDYIGRDDQHNGLHALDRITDVNFVAIPGNTSANVISSALGYCNNRRDCFFIADAPERTGGAESAFLDAVGVRDFFLNRITVKRSYGAIYYPWLQASDPKGRGRNPRRYLPPSGFVAGLYARIDNARGVWKAPAGTEATLTGAIALSYPTSDAEQELLNPIGVNCIRQYPGSGIVVWGARTVAAQSDPEWRYVPVRRYAIYLEQSILRGTQWAVFEPNDFPLWESLKSNIDDFLMGEFRKGALAGRTPDQAFEVRCDAELNPASEVNAGRVNMEVKFAPLKPAEFVIIRISQKTQRPES